MLSAPADAVRANAPDVEALADAARARSYLGAGARNTASNPWGLRDGDGFDGEDGEDDSDDRPELFATADAYA